MSSPCCAGSGFIKPGQVLNGIQAHQDTVTSFSCAAGVKDVTEKVKVEKKQYIDGLDNGPYRKGETDKSARNNLLLLRK